MKDHKTPGEQSIHRRRAGSGYASRTDVPRLPWHDPLLVCEDIESTRSRKASVNSAGPISWENPLRRPRVEAGCSVRESGSCGGAAGPNAELRSRPQG